MSRIFDEYWKKWTLSNIAGVWLGIGLSGSIAAGIWQWIGTPQNAGEKLQLLLVMLLVGGLQGFLLGYFQWRVLKEKFPAMAAAQWAGITMAVSVLGWLMGMVPALFFMGKNAQPGVEYQEPALILVIVGAMALGLIFGAIFGIVQWLVLQRFAKESVQWVTGNSLGWGLAMIFIFMAVSLPVETTPVWMAIIGYIFGSALAGLSIGALTGIYLNKIIAENRSRQHPNHGKI